MHIDSLTTLIDYITYLISITIPTAVGVALLFFLWGGFQFMTHGEDPAKRKEAIKRMTFGGIALFIIVSLGGIVWLLIDTFFQGVL